MLPSLNRTVEAYLRDFGKVEQVPTSVKCVYAIHTVQDVHVAPDVFEQRIRKLFSQEKIQIINQAEHSISGQSLDWSMILKKNTRGCMLTIRYSVGKSLTANIAHTPEGARY